MTDAAATALRLAQVGLEHREEYPDAGVIAGRILELGEPPARPLPSAARGS